MRVRSAVILAAGFGTRRLPITKAIEKSMLPIGNRPLIDYLVADLAAAGIERIIFVVGEQSEQLRTYYGHNQRLETYLRDKQHHELLEEVLSTGRGISFEYIVQPADGRYGSAIPLSLAVPLLIDEEGYIVTSGDDFTWGNGVNDFLRLINAGEDNGSHVVLGDIVPEAQVSRFGILETDDTSILKNIIEKPQPDQTLSRMRNISKYYFNRSFTPFIERYTGQERSGEYMLTDVIDAAILAGEQFHVLPAHGRYLDGGTLDGWLEANIIIAGNK